LELIFRRRHIPPLPWGTGGEKPPDGGLGANPFAVERASARRGAGRQPRACAGNSGVRLPSALVPATAWVAFGGAVHVLIRCFHDCDLGKGWNVTFLFSHSGGARWQA
jgi:hypothetical protein